MNRYRLNHILKVLLFPLTDPALAKEDPLLSCYQAYHNFMDRGSVKSYNMQERNRKDSNYKDAKRKLVNYMVERNQGKVKSKDDIQMLCDYFYPMTDIEQVMEQLSAVQSARGIRGSDIDNLSWYYLRSLSRISRSLITYRDGVASIKQWIENGTNTTESDIFNSATVFNKIEIWNLLCRISVPDVFIAIAAMEYKVGLKGLFGQKANITLSDRLLENCVCKGMAENHLHFNAGYDYVAIWLPYMNLDFIEEIERERWGSAEYVRLELALFRYIAACYLMEDNFEQGFCGWIDYKLPPQVVDVLDNLYHGNCKGKTNLQLMAEIYRIRTSIRNDVPEKKYDCLLNEIYVDYVEYKTSSEFILLYQSYQYVIENKMDTFFAKMFLQYLRLKNDFFSKSHQNHVMQGLTYFQESYNMTKRHASTVLPEKELMIEIFRSQAKVSNLKKLEIRIAPKVNGMELDLTHYARSRKDIYRQLYDQIYHVLYAYREYILESTIGIKKTRMIIENERDDICRRKLKQNILDQVRESKVNIPTLGIVFHFLKSEHLEDRSGNYCWRTIMNGEEHHTAYRMMKRIYLENVARALEEIRGYIPGLHEYIVGIDAASDENAMEPWMFSPAYKIIRSQDNINAVIERGRKAERFERIQNMGFTYHVGEDFRHIISGLRHIDEVLEEFAYKAGDRLGHALALGIDIEQWMKDNEVVPIPMLEHLENLLWMWGINTCRGLNLPIQLEVLESRIMELATKLYEHPETISIRMLYAAYKKKFDTDHREIAKRNIEREKYALSYCPDFDERKNMRRWTEEQLLLTNYCPMYEQKYEKIELVSVSGEEMEVYKVLQQYLVHKVERRGIYIETNPTSNLTIGDFPNMYQHPIFSLNDINKNIGYHAFVTINSDDPAVFNTNVENELAYIYYAAEAQGFAKSDIIDWVDRIRQYGMDACFVHQEKETVQILIELESIMNAIAATEV